uniref:ShKT domain-containing protein n=1 Tax=Steinernema glaseri TaxID=37863 RepID=A0A1I7Y906_9BILA
MASSTNVLFRLIQCCTACNKNDDVMAYDLVARSLVSEQCFDRYGPAFCGHYVNSTDVWSPMHWSCEGQSPHVAFRACRKSCGFCDFNRVLYSLDNALAACKVDRGAEGAREPYPAWPNAFTIDGQVHLA